MKTKYYLVESKKDGRPMYTATKSELSWLKTHFVPETENDCFDGNYFVSPIRLIKEFKQKVFLFETENEDETLGGYESEYVLSAKDRKSSISDVYAIHEDMFDVLDDWTDLVIKSLDKVNTY